MKGSVVILNPKITIFTPTYNRKELLSKCYNSLLKQSNKQFVWQIIDDGSEDETNSLVDKWIEEGEMNIEYIYKENGGKVSAINRSLEITNTKYWFCLDSDDYLTDNAIEIIIKKLKLIEDNENICGLLGLRIGIDGKPMGNVNSIPADLKFAKLRDIRIDLGIDTEYIQVFKTKVVKQYPYPLIKGEKFMALSFAFDQIDAKYNYLIIHEGLMISEYQEDGMTKHKRKLIKENPKGYTLYNKQRFLLEKNLKQKIKAAILYNIGNILDIESNVKKSVEKSPSKFITAILYPLSYIIYKIRYAG